MARVWVVGSLNVDRGWRVARHPAIGETVVGSVVPPAPGGKGLNQAVAARRIGADVSLIGRVGDDADGAWLLDVARAEGIDVSLIGRSVESPTGSALIVVDADGANTVTVDAGANATLDPSDLADLALAAGDVVVAQLEVPVAAVASAFRLARSAGATTVLNPSPVGTGADLLPLADAVVVNQTEARWLAGAPAEASGSQQALAQARAIASADQAVVVTLGAGGVVGCGPDGDVVVDGSSVRPVDTTGAGDCFLGVLAAGLAEGVSLLVAVERANRAAAISTTRPGTVAAMPTAREVDSVP